MNPQYAKLMTHRFTIRKRERNWQGDFADTATYTDIRGFAEYGKHLVTDRKGEQVLASAIVFLREDAPVDSEHEHWMFDQTFPYLRSNLEVIRVDPIDDPRTGKTHHYEVAVR